MVFPLDQYSFQEYASYFGIYTLYFWVGLWGQLFTFDIISFLLLMK